MLLVKELAKCSGKYHRKFAAFRAAIEQSMIELHETKRDKLETMMTLNFQTVEKVLLMAAWSITEIRILKIYFMFEKP